MREFSGRKERRDFFRTLQVLTGNNHAQLALRIGGHSVEQGHFLHARSTPRSPEVEQNRCAFEIG